MTSVADPSRTLDKDGITDAQVHQNLPEAVGEAGSRA